MILGSLVFSNHSSVVITSNRSCSQSVHVHHLSVLFARLLWFITSFISWILLGWSSSAHRPRAHFALLIKVLSITGQLQRRSHTLLSQSATHSRLFMHDATNQTVDCPVDYVRGLWNASSWSRTICLILLTDSTRISNFSLYLRSICAPWMAFDKSWDCFWPWLSVRYWKHHLDCMNLWRDCKNHTCTCASSRCLEQ